MTKFSPFKIADGVTPADTSLTVVGAPLRIPAMERATLWIRYVSADSDARLSMAVEVHRSPSEARVNDRVVRVPVLAPPTLADLRGRVYEGIVTFNYPGIDVSGAWSARAAGGHRRCGGPGIGLADGELVVTLVPSRAGAEERGSVP